MEYKTGINANPHEGLFQIMVNKVVTYADSKRTPAAGDLVVVVRDGLTTIEYYSNQDSNLLAGVVVPKPE